MSKTIDLLEEDLMVVHKNHWQLMNDLCDAVRAKDNAGSQSILREIEKLSAEMRENEIHNTKDREPVDEDILHNGEV